MFASGSSLMAPKTAANATWQVGILPDTMQTFSAALIAMGLASGLSISVSSASGYSFHLWPVVSCARDAMQTFRLCLFREPDIRLLDFIIVLVQVRHKFICSHYAMALISLPLC